MEAKARPFLNEGLRRYVYPSDDELVDMWTQVLARRGDARKADFLPVETLLCFALGLATPPSPSGHVNVKKAAPETRLLAELFGRPPGSLQSKHSNLEARPGRDGGRSTDPHVGAFFASEPDHFAAVYGRTLGAARTAGISDDALPDFLGAESGQLQVVIDAGRLTNEQLYDLTSAGAMMSAQDPDGEDSNPTVGERLTTVRLTQQRFARAVLERSNFSCVFCGLSTRRVSLPSARLLIAGHIKPWRLSNATERSSAYNGLAACPTHDAAFEAQLMTVQPDGRVVYSASLARAIASDPAWSSAFSAVTSHVLLPVSAVAASAQVLRWHRSYAASTVERGVESLRSWPGR